MNRGSVIIIPNEDKIQDDYFEYDIYMDHIEGFQEFSKKYNLNIDYNKIEYNDIPIRITKEGHLTIKTIKDLGVALIYIPQVITKRQKEWLSDNMKNFMYYNLVEGYKITDDDLGLKKIKGYFDLKNELDKNASSHIK